MGLSVCLLHASVYDECSIDALEDFLCIFDHLGRYEVLQIWNECMFGLVCLFALMYVVFVTFQITSLCPFVNYLNRGKDSSCCC